MVLTIVVAAALLLPVTGAVTTGGSPVSESPQLTATLHVGTSTTTLDRQFFGVNGDTAPTDAFTKSARLDRYLNSTPIDFVRYGAGEDECNITTDTAWAAGVLGGVVVPGAEYTSSVNNSWVDGPVRIDRRTESAW
jgi:hypothetical protein